MLTTYGTVRRDPFDLQEIAFDYVVLDEAQAIKNAATAGGQGRTAAAAANIASR